MSDSKHEKVFHIYFLLLSHRSERYGAHAQGTFPGVSAEVSLRGKSITHARSSFHSGKTPNYFYNLWTLQVEAYLVLCPQQRQQC